jgi:hypothetical protein
MRHPILAGAVAFIVAGVAIAGQGKIPFTSEANSTPNIEGAAPPTLWNVVAADIGQEIDSTKSYSILAATTTGQILSDISTKNSLSTSTYLPTENSHVVNITSVNTNQIVDGSGYAVNNSLFISSFNDGLGGNTNGDILSALVGQFENANGSTWGYLTWAPTGNLTYPVVAVPEPDEWLLMLLGVGLVGLIASHRKQKVTVALHTGLKYPTLTS